MTTHSFPRHVCMGDLTTERSVHLQATWVIEVLDLFSDMLSMGVCTTSHWQMSGWLVQELNVCTVHHKDHSNVYPGENEHFTFESIPPIFKDPFYINILLVVFLGRFDWIRNLYGISQKKLMEIYTSMINTLG